MLDEAKLQSLIKSALLCVVEYCYELELGTFRSPMLAVGVVIFGAFHHFP